ncbi:MAG: CAP domain-containing protein [bacterium]
MNKLNTKKFHILHGIFSISEIGICVLFFLLPYIAVATPISKELILKLTNDERISQNLMLLEQNNVLEKVAQEKAQDILEKQYFAHTNPAGKPFYEWVDESGYNYAYAGENLAIDFVEAEDAIKAWMASPKHRENILNENYSETGVGALDGIFEGHLSTVIVQIFGQPFMKLTKLDKYNSLEEQTYSTLIKGEANNKAISDVPMNDENGFMLNTPLTLENNNTDVYELATDTLSKASTSANGQESKDNNIKLTLNRQNDSRAFDDFNLPSFNILLIISVSIIIFSIYGTILENIKSSFRMNPKHAWAHKFK